MSRISIVLLIIVGSVLLVPAGVQAEAVKIPFTATYTGTGAGEPVRAWVDHDGIMHVRGLPVTADITGDISGSGSHIINNNIDQTGNGDGFGSFILDVTWQGLTGTFEGRFSYRLTDGVTYVEFVGQGSRGFAGLKIIGTGETGPAGGTLMLEGIILNPHG